MHRQVRIRRSHLGLSNLFYATRPPARPVALLAQSCSASGRSCLRSVHSCSPPCLRCLHSAPPSKALAHGCSLRYQTCSLSVQNFRKSAALYPAAAAAAASRSAGAILGSTVPVREICGLSDGKPTLLEAVPISLAVRRNFRLSARRIPEAAAPRCHYLLRQAWKPKQDVPPIRPADHASASRAERATAHTTPRRLPVPVLTRSSAPLAAHCASIGRDCILYWTAKRVHRPSSTDCAASP